MRNLNIAAVNSLSPFSSNMQHKVNKRGKSKSSSQGCTGLQKRPEIDVPSFVEIPTSMQKPSLEGDCKAGQICLQNLSRSFFGGKKVCCSTWYVCSGSREVQVLLRHGSTSRKCSAINERDRKPELTTTVISPFQSSLANWIIFAKRTNPATRFERVCSDNGGCCTTSKVLLSSPADPTITVAPSS